MARQLSKKLRHGNKFKVYNNRNIPIHSYDQV